MILKVFMVVVVGFISTSFAAESDRCMHDANTFRCVQYIRNYDGDTITFNIPNIHPLLGSEINVRVLGVDTPELKTKNSCEQQRGLEIKTFVSKILKNAKNIDLNNVDRDKYFRILANVMIDGKSLSNILLEQGLAYPYDGGTKRVVNWCKPAREIASDNGK